jgi:5-methylcytosine-specific restriction endonuclease McrA
MRRIKQILNAVPTKLKKIPMSTRRYVLEKYNYMCAGNIPGISCSYNILDALEIDHILPKSIKWVDKICNLQVLCSNCHAIKTKRYDTILIQKHKCGLLFPRIIKRHLKRFLKTNSKVTNNL